MTDLTRHPLPVIMLPPGFPVNVLTADECRDEAASRQVILDTYAYVATCERRRLEREIAGWLRLADERTVPS